MSTTTFHVATGDVIEFEVNGSLETALVLLTSGDMMILDLCDGEVPMVVEMKEVGNVRVFNPMLIAA